MDFIYQRQSGRAGIAIGPILFVLAILAVLAAAIAAGSGGFTAGTSTEADRANASGVVNAGFNLRVAMDRLVANGGDASTVSTDPTSGTGLFAPTGSGGGGAVLPGVPAVTSPVSPAGWRFIDGRIANVGADGTADRLAIVQVTSGICAQINRLLVNVTTVPQIAAGANNGTGPVTALHTLASPYAGRNAICFEDTTSATAGFYFIQVLAPL